MTSNDYYTWRLDRIAGRIHDGYDPHKMFVADFYPDSSENTFIRCEVEATDGEIKDVLFNCRMEKNTH